MKKTIFTIIALLNINFLEAYFSPDPKLGDSAYWAVKADHMLQKIMKNRLLLLMNAMSCVPSGF